MNKGIWRRFWVLLPVLVILVIASRVYIRSVADTYEARGFLPHVGQVLSSSDVTLSKPGVVEVISVSQDEAGHMRVTFHAVGDGEVEASAGTPDALDMWVLRVRDNAIFEGGVNFSGWEAIHVSACIFVAVLIVLFASVMIHLWRNAWYGYEMVASGGALLFCLYEFAILVFLLVRGSLFTFSHLASGLTDTVQYFALLTLFPMALLCLLVSASNVSLIRHEGLRPVNLLGIAVSVFFAAVCMLWFSFTSILAGFFESFEVIRIVDSIFAVGLSYGECLLLSTMACAWLASRHTPRHAVDYLVILGCGIRPDGTPSPLLAGRVDRAWEFDEVRVSGGDPPATFVPSGGQGPDEVMSEAQSMRNYLVEKGVAPERIVLEDRSETTRQNMAFSREVIERHAGCDVDEVRVGFSTTNYHVFRGYVCAHEAGMVVEGMGSKTKAYFWPNAFLREFIGLLAAQWRAILQTFVILAAGYVLAEYVLLFV